MADIVVDTFGISEGDVDDANPWVIGQKKMVWTSATVGYLIHGNWDSDKRLVYTKTTDGGQTWGSVVDIDGINVPFGADIWFDKWTNGDTGTLIHFIVVTNAGGVHYNTLDTATDTLGTSVQVANLMSGNVSSGSLLTTIGSIVKARGGNLYVAAQSSGVSGQTDGFFKSTDGGAVWSTEADFIESADVFTLMPGNETDNQDIIAIYWDNSADEVSLKTYDQSGDSWSETSISTGMNHGVFTAPQYSAAPRHSDNHTIVCAWSTHFASAADLKVWDIDTAASITALTNVVAAGVPRLVCALTINQQNDTIYVSFSGEDGDSYFGTVSVNFTSSTDGGSTWASIASINEDSDAANFAPVSDISIGTYGGRYMVSWYKRVGSSTFDYTVYVSFVNSVLIDTQAAFLSGTIFNSRAEDIRAGGKTLIITLTGLTWDSSMGSTNSQTTALINGFDAFTSEATGWNAVVQAGLTSTSVVRTSDTVVTITMPAFPTYFLGAQEVITGTIESTSAS